MGIDLGVCVSDTKSLDSFVQMAMKLGLTGFATSNIEGGPVQRLENGFTILKRVDVSGKGLRSIKKQVTEVRQDAMIVSVKLSSVDSSNWAAEDHRVDLLTLDPSGEIHFRGTTARLAAASGTCLEVRFEPLLHLFGLNRSKVIKVYREAVQTAIGEGMQVILSSGASHALHMRSGRVMRHIGELLGMSTKYAENAVNRVPLDIMRNSEKRLSPDFVTEGIEVVQRGAEE